MQAEPRGLRPFVVFQRADPGWNRTSPRRRRRSVARSRPGMKPKPRPTCLKGPVPASGFVLQHRVPWDRRRGDQRHGTGAGGTGAVAPAPEGPAPGDQRRRDQHRGTSAARVRFIINASGRLLLSGCLCTREQRDGGQREAGGLDPAASHCAASPTPSGLLPISGV